MLASDGKGIAVDGRPFPNDDVFFDAAAGHIIFHMRAGDSAFIHQHIGRVLPAKRRRRAMPAPAAGLFCRNRNPAHPLLHREQLVVFLLAAESRNKAISAAAVMAFVRFLCKRVVNLGKRIGGFIKHMHRFTIEHGLFVAVGQPEHFAVFAAKLRNLIHPRYLFSGFFQSNIFHKNRVFCSPLFLGQRKNDILIFFYRNNFVLCFFLFSHFCFPSFTADINFGFLKP